MTRHYNADAYMARGAMMPHEGMYPYADRREYMHDENDLLFVVEQLPEHESPDLIFGPSTQKMFQTMQAAGLIRIEDDDPLAIERDVFFCGNQPGFKYASIVQLVRPPVRATGRMTVVVHDWERICERLLDNLNVQKLVLVGDRVVKSYAKRTLSRFNPAHGYLGQCRDEARERMVPLYAVRLRGGSVEDWRLLCTGRSVQDAGGALGAAVLSSRPPGESGLYLREGML